MLFLVVFFGSCIANEKTSLNDEEKLKKLIIQSISVRDKITDFVVLSGKNSAEIIQILETGDEALFRKEFNIPEHEYSKFKTELDRINLELSEIPSIKKELTNNTFQRESKSCGHCLDKELIEMVINNRKSQLFQFHGSSFRTKEPELDDASCEWVQYALCLVLCTSTGPLYWPCAYLCVCAYCDGGNIKEICI
jgi:hypothetical protein